MQKINISTKTHPNTFAIVDDADFEELNRFKWYAAKGRNTFYARRNIYDPLTQKWTTIKMHRVIINPPKNKEIDHISHDGLDNRRVNLRICTTSENQWNQRKQNNCSSKHKGIYWNKREHKWMARIRINGKRLVLGYFKNEVEAAEAYDEAAIKHHGEFARLNFPQKEIRCSQ